MRQTIQLLLVICVFSLMLPAASHAADDEPTASQLTDRAAIETKIAVLKEQINELHKQLYDLQRKLALLDGTSETSDADSDPLIASASQTMPPVIESPDADQADNNDEPKPEKPFRSGADIIKRIPVELIPKPEEMTDEFKIGAINEWLAEEMLGKKMQVTCVVRNPRTTSTYAQRRTAERQWTLNVELTENATSRFRTIQVATRYYRPHFNTTMRKYYPSAIKYEGDGDFKKVADRVEDGHSAKIEGVIKVIEFKHSVLTKPQWTLSIALVFHQP